MLLWVWVVIRWVVIGMLGLVVSIVLCCFIWLVWCVFSVCMRWFSRVFCLVLMC